MYIWRLNLEATQMRMGIIKDEDGDSPGRANAAFGTVADICAYIYIYICIDRSIDRFDEL